VCRTVEFDVVVIVMIDGVVVMIGGVVVMIGGVVKSVVQRKALVHFRLMVEIHDR